MRSHEDTTARRMAPVAVTLLLATFITTDAAAQDVNKVIEDASATMGVVGLDAITYSGTAAIGNFGQSRRISFGLTSTQIRNYARTIDFTAPASRATGDMPGAPGAPPPLPGNYDEIVSRDTPAWEHQLLIWTTPWGFLRGAAAAPNAKVRKQKVDDVEYRVVSWSPAQKAPSGEPYRLVGYINFENLIARVETWVEHPIFGDMHVEFRYRDYDRVGAVMVPRRVARRDVGMETFVAVITNSRRTLMAWTTCSRSPHRRRVPAGQSPRRRHSPRSSPRVFIASMAVTRRSPSNSRITSSSSRQGRAKRAVWRSSPR
jgi:hypothetical protein